MNNKTIYIAAAGAAVLLPLALFLRTFSGFTLPKPDPCTGPLPSATSPKEMAVFALVTGVNHRVAAYGYRGGSLFERRDFSMAATLVKHPQGDLLIDTGFGRKIDEQFLTMPLMFRAMTFYTLRQPHDMRAFAEMPTLSPASSEAARPAMETKKQGRENTSLSFLTIFPNSSSVALTR